MDYKIVNFKVRGDERGSLIAIEGNQDVPFEIKRVYYVYGTQKNAVRGKHSHKKLQQMIFCSSGSCDFTVDNGKKRQTIRLESPDQGLLLQGNIWREFTNFSPDCVVTVLASEHYDEADYVRDYNEFVRQVNK